MNMQMDIEYFDCVTSTNSVLADMAKNGALPGKTVVAWMQTEGRGRLGRTFVSPRGGIYMSMLLKNDDTMLLTARAGVAIKRAIEEITGLRVQIKWVNDILINGRKVAGILAQGMQDLVVVGVGINFCVDLRDLGSELADSAASLYKSRDDARVDAVDLVNAVARHMYGLAAETDNSRWLGEYRASSAVIGRRVNVWQAGVKTGSGMAVSVDDSCALHVLDESKGEMILSTGEITLRLD